MKEGAVLLEVRSLMESWGWDVSLALRLHTDPTVGKGFSSGRSDTSQLASCGSGTRSVAASCAHVNDYRYRFS